MSKVSRSGTRAFLMSPEFNLVLLYNPGALDSNDFLQIAGHVRSIAPEIEVFVTANDTLRVTDDVLRRAAGSRTLIFSPQPLYGLRPRRGKIYCGKLISKLEQMKRLREAGLPVPDWKVIEPKTKLRSERWGPVVVVKPSAWGSASLGRGIQLSRTEDVRYRSPDEYPPQHPGREGPMIAQRFIDTGLFSEDYRILSLFGEPLYAVRRTARIPRPSLDASSSVLAKTSVAITVRGRDAVTSFCYEEDVLTLTRRIHDEVFPEVPLQGCDLVRDASSGELYALEINPGGNTWHFSSGGVASQHVEGKLRQEQFGAFERAARILVQRTRAEAA